MNELGFVGRERELAQLQGFLDGAMKGQGQVAFIAGEAGSGKTALLRQFAARAERTNPELVIAVGNCNAQTGVGDPYLPFREVLTLLTTGDVEGRLSQGSITPENADRLRKLVSRSVQVLVEVGPDLVEVLVPGAKLMAAVGKAVANKVGWMDDLERLAQRQPGQLGTTPVEQNRLFEQYTNVLKALAAEQPLVLIVDDLHWADTGSIALLFHLARRIERSRILILGTYRPNEVALGREDSRHPLEPVLNELRRYQGEIIIDLGRVIATEGRAFAEALLDTLPNRLGPKFRAALYRHTGGHPLFTVELLRSMAERGDLIEDEEGYWVEGPDLDWTALPARVEGVIAERLDRLDKELYDILSVASVEGIDFTAQVIARVEQKRERQLLQTLSQHLERRHGLVKEQGETRISRHLLWRYQFAHALFQQYLYDELSAGERRILHGEIARALEELYSDRVKEIAVQLARHYDQAGEDERAVAYLIEAGDAASRVYAYAEARLHYDKALALLEQLPSTPEFDLQRVDTTIKLASVSTVSEDPERILERLHAVEPLARTLPSPTGAPGGDVLRMARVQYWIGRAHYTRGKPNEAAEYYRRVMAVAQELDDEELQTVLASRLGAAKNIRGRFDEALTLLEQALPALEKYGNWEEWIRCAANLSIALAAHGRCDEAEQWSADAIRRAQELNHLTALGVGYLLQAWSNFLGGDIPAMEEAARKTIAVAQEAGDALSLYAGYGELAWAQTRLGRLDEALVNLGKARQTARIVEGPLILSDLFAVAEVELALRQRNLEKGLALAEAAVATAKAASSIFAEGLAERFWAMALAALNPPRWDEAESHLATSLERLEEGGALTEAARTRVVWGRLLEQRGNPTAALEQFEQAVEQFDACGLTSEAERARRRMMRLQAS